MSEILLTVVKLMFLCFLVLFLFAMALRKK